MAKVFSAPFSYEIDYTLPWKEYKNLEEAYIKQLADFAKEDAKDPLIGKIIRFPIADGYAQYMVWNTKPLELVHIATGDAWSIPDAHARGLRLADIRQMVESEERLDALFNRKKDL